MHWGALDANTPPAYTDQVLPRLLPRSDDGRAHRSPLKRTFWAAHALCWRRAGSAGERWGSWQPGCRNTVVWERCGWPCPTVAARWRSATPSARAPTLRPTLCSGGEPGSTPDMKPRAQVGSTKRTACWVIGRQCGICLTHLRQFQRRWD